MFKAAVRFVHGKISSLNTRKYLLQTSVKSDPKPPLFLYTRMT